jgi:8-oxo-dGTP pyrophosphatase MutT (NUDIX family)
MSVQGAIEGALGMMPAPVHRVALRVLHGLRKQWWRLRKPALHGCRILALDEAGRVLLVRHSYGPSAWMPPGGGVAPGEDPVLAAAREFAEELGCGLGEPRLVATMLDTLHGAGNHVNVVLGRCEGVPVPDRREITHAGFFAADALPHDLAKGLAEKLPGWMAA